MKLSYFVFAGICLSGCMTSNSLKYSAAAEDNIYRLSRIEIGMGEREVIQIMHKPYSYQSFQVGEDVYDVWFYVTRTTGLDQTRMVPQNLTPLTFKNGQLIGRGYDYYNFLTKEANKAARVQETKDKAPVEDKNIEKALQTKPLPPSPPVKEEDRGIEKALDSHPRPPAQNKSQELEKIEPSPVSSQQPAQSSQ